MNATELIESLPLTMAVNGKDFYKMYFADDVEKTITDLCDEISTKTDLKQLQEDSFASAMRRYPEISPEGAIKKMYEEMEELDDAWQDEADGGRHLSPHCPELTAKAEEWADVLFALLVFAKLENIDIDKCLRIKNEFNKVRK